MGLVQDLLGTAEEEHEDVDRRGYVHGGHVEKGFLRSDRCGAKEVWTKHGGQVIEVHLVLLRVGRNSGLARVTKMRA